MSVSTQQAIRQAALDYAQGLYEGDAERMRRCLHPELARRAILHDSQTGEQCFHHLTKQRMVEKTRKGGGSADAPSDKRYYDVSILDVYGGIATVRAESYDAVDYLHLAFCNGQWLIVNILWTENYTGR